MNKKELREAAIAASSQAYSPYSKARVGSAVLTDNGKIYSGCNIENSSYGGTVCAERVAVLKAVSEGHRTIDAVYVYSKEGWPPCGLCRQVIAEFATNSTLIIIGDESGRETEYSFNELMPLAFTQEHLK